MRESVNRMDSMSQMPFKCLVSLTGNLKMKL